MAVQPNTLPRNAPQDLTGHVFGRLAVIGFAGHDRQGIKARSRRMWLCLCSCGAEVRVAANALRSGHTGSCGCLMRERTSASRRKHGHCRGELNGRKKASAEYTAYVCIKARCYRDVHKDFHLYGGRGIVICDRWLSGETGASGFECFFADMGHKPSPKHSVERDDVNGPYSPKNCRWATMKEQQRNRRNSIFLTIDGVTKHIMEWSEGSGLTYATIQKRFYKGLPPDKLLAPSRYAKSRSRPR